MKTFVRAIGLSIAVGICVSILALLVHATIGFPFGRAFSGVFAALFMGRGYWVMTDPKMGVKVFGIFLYLIGFLAFFYPAVGLWVMISVLVLGFYVACLGERDRRLQRNGGSSSRHTR